MSLIYVNGRQSDIFEEIYETYSIHYAIFIKKYYAMYTISCYYNQYHYHLWELTVITQTVTLFRLTEVHQTLPRGFSSFGIGRAAKLSQYCWRKQTTEFVSHILKNPTILQTLHPCKRGESKWHTINWKFSRFVHVEPCIRWLSNLAILLIFQVLFPAVSIGFRDLANILSWKNRERVYFWIKVHLKPGNFWLPRVIYFSIFKSNTAAVWHTLEFYNPSQFLGPSNSSQFWLP